MNAVVADLPCSVRGVTRASPTPVGAVLAMLAFQGCSDSAGPDVPLDWGSFTGSATVVDRGTTYSNTPFQASLSQSYSVVGTLTVGLSTWDVVGSMAADRSVAVSMELTSTPANPSPGYVRPAGFVYSGSMVPSEIGNGGAVLALSGAFTGPDGFGGTLSVTFTATRD